MQKATTPIRVVKSYSKAYPKFFRVSSCPVTTIDDVSRSLALSYGLELSAASHLAPCVAACSQWIQDKKIYWFEPELARVLVDQAEPIKEEDTLPLGILRDFPGCVYMKAPDVITEGIDGCFLWVEGADDHAVLRFVFLLSDLRSFTAGSIGLTSDLPVIQCLPESDTLAYANLMAASQGDPAALELALDHIQADTPFRSVFHNLILRAVQLAMYLTSDNAEITPFTIEESGLSQLRSDPEIQSCEIYSVGLSISSQLRQTDSEAGKGSGSQRKAHIRKGHWHHYWKGPKNGERQLVLHWIAPVMVAGDKKSK